MIFPETEEFSQKKPTDRPSQFTAGEMDHTLRLRAARERRPANLLTAMA